MGRGAIFRNEIEKIMTTSANFLNIKDNTMTTETMALNKSLEMVIDCCFLDVHFEMDNQI